MNNEELFWEELCARLRKLRDKYGYTQRDVADQIGIGKSAYRSYHYYRCNTTRINKACNNTRSHSEVKIEKFLLEMIQPEIKRYIAEYEVESKAPVKKLTPRKSKSSSASTINLKKIAYLKKTMMKNTRPSSPRSTRPVLTK